MKLNKAQVRDILALTYPEYRGRKYAIEFVPTLMIYNTNWAGGSRNTYTAIRYDGRCSRLGVPAPWVNTVEGKTIELTPEIMIVKHCIFCGRDLGITIYAHPSHLPKWLPATTAPRDNR